MSITNIQSNPHAISTLQKANALKMQAEQHLHVINSASNGNSVDALKMQESGMVSPGTKSSNLTQDFFSFNESNASIVKDKKLQFDMMLAKAQGHKVEFKEVSNAKSLNLPEFQGDINKAILGSQFNPQSAVVQNSTNNSVNANNHANPHDYSAYGLENLFLDFRLRTFASKESSDATEENKSNVDTQSKNKQAKEQGQENVDLANLTLDFTSMLPQGMRNFLQALKCPLDEEQKFVNLMVFGQEQGPHGKNASEFFHTDSMNIDEFKAQLDSIITKAKINAANLNSDDYNLIALENGKNVAEVLEANGLKLNAKTFEHQNESTYQSDMAMMQILANTNKRDASMF